MDSADRREKGAMIDDKEKRGETESLATRWLN